MKKQCNYRLTPQAIEQIKALAKFEEVSDADIIEAAIDYFLDLNYPSEYVTESGEKHIFKRRKKFDNMRSVIKEKLV